MRSFKTNKSSFPESNTGIICTPRTKVSTTTNRESRRCCRTAQRSQSVAGLHLVGSNIDTNAILQDSRVPPRDVHRQSKRPYIRATVIAEESLVLIRTQSRRSRPKKEELQRSRSLPVL